ncbi:MAG: L,D-transpeptidase [Acidobacteriota bacterium]
MIDVDREMLEELQEAAPEPESKKKGWRIFRILSLAAASLVVLFSLFIFSSGYSYIGYSQESVIIRHAWDNLYQQSVNDWKEIDKQITGMKNKNKKMKKTLEAFMPKSEYIVIDSAYNRLYLRKGDKTLLDAVCSAGSGAILVDTPSGRKWVFDTPRGEFQILSKQENPVWKKPDWAFIEEGKQIPKEPSERFEYGMLGEYALYFSKNGYLIHGTLYERLLGKSITHGCIRVGRDDLRVLYQLTKIGTKVYAY